MVDIFYIKSLGGEWESTRGQEAGLLIMYSFDDLYQYTKHKLLLYQNIIMQFSSAIVDFYSFYDRLVDMQI